MDLLGLASSHSLPLSLLVEEEQQDDLNTDESNKGDEDDEDSSDTGSVVGLVLGLEEKWSDNVTCCTGGVEESHCSCQPW